MSGGMTIKPFRVRVDGYEDSYVHYTRSRMKALADSWRGYCSYIGYVHFKHFLKIAHAWAVAPSDRFGEAMTVCGEPALYVSHNSQYIQFVRPGSELILNTHPLDVEPPEARRGTPYYSPEPSLCEDCPPVGYPTDKTRCTPCPRRSADEALK